MPIESLQQYLKLWDELKIAPSNLRFGYNYVPVHKIANQHYCEKQVELREIHGQEETQAMKRGKEGHEAATLFAHKVPTEKIWREAFRQNRRKSYKVLEFHLLAKHQGILIVGRADMVSFLRGSALYLRDLKFRDSGGPRDTDKVQCRIYGYLLNRMGFDTTKLEYEIFVLPPSDRDVPFWAMDQDVVEHWKYNFDFDKAVQELDFVLGFWRREREAIPTKKAWKCRPCSFNETCPFSKAGQDKEKPKRKLAKEERRQRYVELRVAGATPDEARRIKDWSYNSYLDALMEFRARQSGDANSTSS